MTYQTLGATLMGAFLLASTPALAQEGDPEAGAKVFNKCRACHVVDKEQNRVGPHLVGIIGRPAGAVEDFNYSDAMANADIVWDEETISEYLADPKGYIPGNKMSFAGLPDEQDRLDVVAYLQEQSGG